ncbi:hypothetical protein HDU89_004517 [Geranomyces variabilis]|nr:hypothetical protein HDU89_004517 [Geranomyces variabilis]
MDAELRETAQIRQRRLQEHSKRQQEQAERDAAAAAQATGPARPTGAFSVLPSWITPYDLVAVIVISLAWDFSLIGQDLMRLLLAVCGLIVFIRYRKRFDTKILPDGTIKQPDYRPPPTSSSSGGWGGSGGGGGGGGFADFKSINGNGTTVNYSGCGGGGCGR